MARRPGGGRPGRCEGEQGLLSGGATGTCVLVCVCVCVCCEREREREKVV